MTWTVKKVSLTVEEQELLADWRAVDDCKIPGDSRSKSDETLWDTIRSYMNTRAGRKPEWCLKQRKNIDMICANQCSSTKCILPYLERILHSIGKEMVTLTALTLDFGQWELSSDSS